jgi:glycosyltransferase involved in cell wall biosynthesis
METKPYLEASQYRKQVRERYGFSSNEVVIGKIARLFPLKGHEYVLQAAPRIIEEIPNARFFFVGDGILKDTLQEKASRLGINDKVVFAGLVDASKIPIMVSAMDILVHASLREGLPRVLVQALLGEKPVVSFSVDGAPEVVINGETGYLVRPRAVNELARAVIKLASNPSLAKQMGRNGRRLFLDQFKAETMVSKISDLYLHLLQHQV